MDPQTVTPLDAVIEGAARIRLGEQAREAIRREQIRALGEAQTEIEAAFVELGFLNQPTARGELERLGTALDAARAAADALWYLAPDDGAPLDEEGR